MLCFEIWKNLKYEDILKYEDDIKTEDNLKYEENLMCEADLKPDKPSQSYQNYHTNLSNQTYLTEQNIPN